MADEATVQTVPTEAWPALFDPSAGHVVRVHPSDVPGARLEGYTDPTPEQVKAAELQRQYGGLGQQALTGLEAAGSAATFGASDLLERGLGVEPEDMAGREAANPLTHAAGTVGGIGASLLIPGSPVARVGQAGTAIAKGVRALAPEGASIAARALASAGGRAAGSAVEGALFGLGNVVHEAALGDPNLNAQSAAAQIGFGALLGGGLGAGLGLGEVLVPAALREGRALLGKVTLGLDERFRKAIPAIAEAAGGPKADIGEMIRDNWQRLSKPGAFDEAVDSMNDGIDGLSDFSRRGVAFQEPLLAEYEANAEKMNAQIKGEFGRWFLDPDTELADLDKIRAYFKGVGSSDPAFQPATDSLNEYIKTAKQMVDSWSNVDTLGPKQLADLQRTVADSRALGGASVANEALNGAPSARTAAELGLVGALLEGTGHTLLGPLGLTAGGVMGAVRATKFLANPLAVVETLVAIEHTAQFAARAMDAAASALVRGVEPYAEPTRRFVVAGLVREFGKDDDSARRAYERRTAEVQRLANDPAGLSARLDQAAAGVSEHAPQTAQAYQMAGARAVQFLGSKVPSAPAGGMLAPQPVPSRDDIDKFNRYYAAVDRPLNLLRQAQAGTLTPEAVDAVRYVYPELFTQMQRAVLDAVVKHRTENIPYSAKLMIGMMGGLDADGSLRGLQASQATYGGGGAPGVMQAPGKGAAPSGAGKLTLSNRTLTPAQASSMRVNRK